VKIITESKLEEIAAREKSKKKKIVLVGGVFDILHPGHIHFLKSAKFSADSLFLLLESDENVRKLKGNGRPINNQNARAWHLSKLPFIDYVILLEGVTKSSKYDKLIVQVKPDVIALTAGDPGTALRSKQCKAVGAELLEIDRIATASTTELIKNGKI
jgi:rfaE bifunctional protein nucleotidyltransferase chain/domain